MSLSKPPRFIAPEWPAPKNVRAASSVRFGGVSSAPFDSFNLATHVGDNLQDVESNRKLLMTELELPKQPAWLEQIHSNQVITLPANDVSPADASYCNTTGEVCVVMTADCLPVIFTNRQGTEVAAAHAGWRGLADGILENTVSCFESQSDELIAWMGPAIGNQAFEVGDEVREIFISKLPSTQSAFKAGREGKWFADLYQLARMHLNNIGITNVYGGEYCTYSDKNQFFSYRREGQTGRMATLIWLALDN